MNFMSNIFIILGLMAPSSSFIEGMVIDQLSINVPIKEEPGLN